MSYSVWHLEDLAFCFLSETESDSGALAPSQAALEYFTTRNKIMKPAPVISPGWWNLSLFLIFLSPSLEFGPAVGLCPNFPSSGQENIPWTLLLVVLVNIHQVNNLVSCAFKNYPPRRSSCIRFPPMNKKTPSFASLTSLVTALLFFVSALLAKTQEWHWECLSLHPALILSKPIFSFIYLLIWLAILHLISQEILKCTTFNHYHMIILSVMG